MGQKIYNKKQLKKYGMKAALSGEGWKVKDGEGGVEVGVRYR
jgi:hypothetical protein